MKILSHDVVHFLLFLSFLISLIVPETRFKWVWSELVYSDLNAKFIIGT